MSASQPLQPTAPASVAAPPAGRDPLVWFTLGLVVIVAVGGLVYLGYRHPTMVAPASLGLAALAIVAQVVTWLVTHSRS
ncbi:hypothetical protein [Streptomyces sp. NPDC029003]|uniref:hypothetical protein n=1 Tax=Streptomyces sp. NPDC029003 TaxID=3155125 RepID=UPI0033D65F2C